MVSSRKLSFCNRTVFLSACSSRVLETNVPFTGPMKNKRESKKQFANYQSE